MLCVSDTIGPDFYRGRVSGFENGKLMRRLFLVTR